LLADNLGETITKMIHTHYRGQSDICSGFGNHMFQYAVSRILSKQTKYFLNAVKPGKFLELNTLENNDIVYQDNPLIYDKSEVDYDELSKHRGLLYMYGFFQSYQNIKNDKEYVRRIYFFEKDKTLYDDNLISVHIRLGEYYRDDNHLPIEYYIDVIKDSKKIPVIYTNEPNNPLIDEIQKLFNCEVISNSEWEDFVSIASYKNIIISQSSYSWWAAWLSDASTIYYPRTSKRYWQHRNDGNDINLIVDDESRYIFV
jgi:hypothetical protein